MVTKDFSRDFSERLEKALSDDSFLTDDSRTNFASSNLESSVSPNITSSDAISEDEVMDRITPTLDRMPAVNASQQRISPQISPIKSAGEKFYNTIESAGSYASPLISTSSVELKSDVNLMSHRSLDDLLKERVAPTQMRNARNTLYTDTSELTSLKASNVNAKPTLVVNRTLNYTHADAITVRVGIVIFPGTLDDRDAARAIKKAGGRPVPLWHGDESITSVDAIVIPGGFSYGDYLRCGAISRFAKVMEKVQDAAKAGVPVLGICNGFQILTEAHLLPGALVKNSHQKFICKSQELIVENNNTSWSYNFEDKQRIQIPLKNGEGRFVADQKTLDKLEEQEQVVFRYAGTNPNGSTNDIAGICNERGNIVGLMPHPEHAVEAGFGVDGGKGSGVRSGVDGLLVFQSLIAGILRDDTVKESMRIIEQGDMEDA